MHRLHGGGKRQDRSLIHISPSVRRFGAGFSGSALSCSGMPHRRTGAMHLLQRRAAFVALLSVRTRRTSRLNYPLGFIPISDIHAGTYPALRNNKAPCSTMSGLLYGLALRSRV